MLEIGPGLGTLTIKLAEKSKKVIAVEKDHVLVKILNKELRKNNIDNVEIIQGDILKIINSKQLPGNSYNKVVGSLPFYLTSPFIRQLIETPENRPLQMTLVIQKEVAQRICAWPPGMSLLAVSVQFYARPKIVSYISKKSFWPSPKVNSAIIQITKINVNKKINSREFFKIVRAGFSRPRKLLISNLSKNLSLDKIKVESWLCKNNIQPDQRAETLNVEDWIKLIKNLKIK